MSTTGYAQTPSLSRPIPRIRPARSIGLKKEMKLSWKQRLANWLTSSSNEDHYSNQPVEADSLNSNGMRFNLYKASGGFVIETRIYDERNDRNINKLHVITEDQNLGEEIGKIITMESLR
jgi:hypothetical protein